MAPKWVLAQCILVPVSSDLLEHSRGWFVGPHLGDINIIQHQQQLCYGTVCHLNPELPYLPGTGIVMSYVYITLLRFRAAMLVQMGMFILVLATLSYRV